MHISHGHSQNWNSMICKLAKWISSKQVIGVCHQSLAASNRIPSRKSIKNPPLHSYTFQLILSSRGLGGGGCYWISGLQRGNQNPAFIFWFSWIPGEPHWSLNIRKALGPGRLLTDWTHSIWKCKTEMSEVFTCWSHFQALVKMWQPGGEVLRNQFLSLALSKKRCCVIKVAAVRRMGGSISWLSDASVTFPCSADLFWFSA